MGFRGLGVEGFWGFGVLGFWGFGVLGFWGFGVRVLGLGLGFLHGGPFWGSLATWCSLRMGTQRGTIISESTQTLILNIWESSEPKALNPNPPDPIPQTRAKA